MGYTAEYQSTLRQSIEQMKQQLINMYNEKGVIDEGIITYSQILDKKIVEFQRIMGNHSSYYNDQAKRKRYHQVKQKSTKNNIVEEYMS